MPYLHCPSCRLSTFSAAADSSRDECPRCGGELGVQPRRLFPAERLGAADHETGSARLASRVRELRARPSLQRAGTRAGDAVARRVAALRRDTADRNARPA